MPVHATVFSAIATGIAVMAVTLEIVMDSESSVQKSGDDLIHIALAGQNPRCDSLV